MERICGGCGEFKQLRIDKDSRYRCRECRAAASVAYQKSAPVKAKLAENARRSYRKFPDHQKARRTLRAAMESGKVARPALCSRCSASGRIEGHHWDYAKPLEVEWLCTRCHADLHKTLDNLGTTNA